MQDGFAVVHSVGHYPPRVPVQVICPMVYGEIRLEIVQRQYRMGSNACSWSLRESGCLDC